MPADGSIRGKCCFKCEDRMTCTRRGTAGDCAFVCEDFRLDRGRYVTLKLQRWEYEFMKKQGKTVVSLDFF